MLFQIYEKKFPTLINCLKNAKVHNKMSHAFLLHGDTPEIRHDFAIVLSQIAICPNAIETGIPCGECRICTQLERGIYSELYELTPSGKVWQILVGDRKNPDPNTARWFENQFYLTSTASGNKKIGIIYDADRMNAESQNAFLKTLEEPPANSFFILATGNPSALLPTTRSRCQTLMLLENHCNFNFEKCHELYQALFNLCFNTKKSIVVAEQSAAAIINIVDHLQEYAEKTVEKTWAEKMSQAAELESPVRKRLEKQYESAIAGEYLKIRHYFIGAINTWIGQLYLLACSAPRHTLANPEIFEGMQLPDVINEKWALNALKEADTLAFNLLFNVNEELAFRSFCLNLAFKC